MWCTPAIPALLGSWSKRTTCCKLKASLSYKFQAARALQQDLVSKKNPKVRIGKERKSKKRRKRPGKSWPPWREGGREGGKRQRGVE